MDRLVASRATCEELQSQLTTPLKITKPHECLSQTFEQNGESNKAEKQTTKSTISTTTEMMGNVKVEPNANINVSGANLNVKSSNETTTSTTGNKYLPTQLTKLSTERVPKACTSTSTSTFSAQTQNLQSEDNLNKLKGFSKERSAKLRAEFFANTIELDAKKTTKHNNKTLLKLVLQDKARNSTNSNYNNCACFPKVQELVQKFEAKQTKAKVNMIVNNTENRAAFSLKPDNIQHHRHSPISDEGCKISPYCSSDEDNDSICTASTAIERPVITNVKSKHKEKVTRSASSDSALGLEVDENMGTPPAEFQPTKRRMTLTVTDLPLRPALLPLAEPTALPDSTTPADLRQSLQALVPTKVLLEERVVELPADESNNSRTCSRRESAQSSLSDYPASECSGVRYMRTPSVVVSDYSDEVMCGITLEEIEYFRAQRSGRRFSSLDTSGNDKDAEGNSDISAASSCSNLYYCGSTISALDGAECYVNGVRVALERKSSDSSDYSGVCEYPEEATAAQETDVNLSSLLASQHLESKPANKKKVGLTPKVVISEV